MEKSLAMTTGGIVALLIGRVDVFIIILCVVLIMDQLTALLVLVTHKELSSFEWLKEIVKSVLTIFIVVIANFCDIVTGANGILRDFVIGFLIANSSMSILENANKCGVPIPKKLMNILSAFKQKDDDENEDEM